MPVTVTDNNNQIILRENENKIILRTGTQTINYLESDQKLYLNGNGGNTYLMYNSSSGRVELWVGGVKQVEWG